MPGQTWLFECIHAQHARHEIPAPHMFAQKIHCFGSIATICVSILPF